MKRTDELTKFVNNIYESGCHYSSDEPKGCSSFDEEYITALMIQATPPMLQENVSELDGQGQLWDLLAAYMKCQSLNNSSDLLTYLVENAVQLHRDRINLQFAARRMSDPKYDTERKAIREQMERDIYAEHNSRI